MCGIAGVLGRPPAPRGLELLAERQRQRGPDDSGVAEIDAIAFLGHTRLSILDLSDAGHQPMGDPTGRFTLTFNGEIYNYRELRRRAKESGWVFRGSSDTEVLLACWALFGEGVLESLNGMFAFCVVDRFEQTAVLVRDRFGVKPLYYKHLEGGLAFASMPDVLASVFGPVGFDRGYLARGLSTWAYDTDGSDSAFSGVSALPGGCLLRVDLSGVGSPPTNLLRWYDFRTRTTQIEPVRGEQVAAAKLRELLTESISLRMRADVPVGLSLSGGLDSSIIAAVASAGASEPIQAFSFSLGPRDKETFAVDQLVENLGPSRLLVTKVGPPAARDTRETLEHALLCQGAPVGGLSALAQFQVFRAARDAGIVVMLGGQGADEAFMGYRKYQAAAIRQSLKGRHLMRATVTTVQLAHTLASERGDVSTYLQAAQRYRSRTRAQGLSSHLPPVDSLGPPASPELLQIDDVLAAGLPTLLRMEDRNSMAHSVESRHPFMDYRVMELGSAFGPTLNVRKGYGKWILRSAFGSDIPRSIAWARYKRGFDPGTGLWLQLGVGEHLRGIIQARSRVIAEALSVPNSAVVPSAYSDAALEGSGKAMHEALVLAWVGLTLAREQGGNHG